MYNRARNHAANFSTILDAAFEMFDEVGKSNTPFTRHNNTTLEREGMADDTVTRLVVVVEVVVVFGKW